MEFSNFLKDNKGSWSENIENNFDNAFWDHEMNTLCWQIGEDDILDIASERIYELISLTN